MAGGPTMKTKGWYARCWNGLTMGLIVITAVHLAALTSTERADEVWPALLSNEPVEVDPNFAALQQRANGSLERLVQATREAEQPL